MVRALKTARYGQAALWIAGFLAVVGSFGLHPEPRGLEVLLTASSRAGWSSVPASGKASHGCLACLAHRPVSLTGLAGVVLEPGSSLRPPNPARLSRPRRLEFPSHEGRAPPALI